MGGTGVGLFRTEYLFMGREEAPSGDEQYAAYKPGLESMNGLPTVIRRFAPSAAHLGACAKADARRK